MMSRPNSVLFPIKTMNRVTPRLDFVLFIYNGEINRTKILKIKITTKQLICGTNYQQCFDPCSKLVRIRHFHGQNQS